MSIKKILGIEEYEHLSDEEVLEKMDEARNNGQTHIEVTDPEGTTIKIDIPGAIDPKDTDDR